MEFRDEYIAACAGEGCSSREIKLLLEIEFCERLSMRHIQRIRKRKGMSARGSESPLQLVQDCIERELMGPGRLLGYRSMWYRLTHKYQLSVRRDTVMLLLGLLDPQGTRQRKSKRLKRRIYRSKGPNFLWHCDGYDKLKPYGIAIHGCIDGYSRQIMWLKAAASNNNPRHISTFYIECVQNINGCPQVLRTDAGTENSLLAVIQPMLRHEHTDPFSQERSHIYGKSTSNQKIEAWWAQLRQHHTEWWMTFFKDIQTEGHFSNHYPHHLDSIRYSFGHVIQSELDRFAEEWNRHRIRQSHMAELPSGIPRVLYNFPDLHGLEDHKCTINHHILQEIENTYSEVPQMVSPEFAHVADSIRDMYGLPLPTTFENGLELYFILLHVLEQYDLYQ